jgi:hypothetical protein
VRKVTLDGKVLLELGVPGKPAPYMSGEPFHRCTHTALSPQGHIYLSDGYGNSRVHKYTPDGKLLMSWGEPAPVKASSTSSTTSAVTPMVGSTSPTVRTTGCRSSTATVSSRPNGRTCTALAGSACPMGHQPIFYVGEVGPAAAVSRDIPNLGSQVSIVDHQGKLIGRFGDTPAGTEFGKFLAPHGLAVDSHGDVYVGEVSWTAWPANLSRSAAPARSLSFCGPPPNAGNFVRLGLRVRLLVRNQRPNSMVYDPIPYASEQGI